MVELAVVRAAEANDFKGIEDGGASEDGGDYQSELRRDGETGAEYASDAARVGPHRTDD